MQKSHGLNIKQTGWAAAGILIDLSSLLAHVSQNFTVPSLLPDTTIFESGEMSRDVISCECALNVLTHYLVRKSHILTLVSTAPEITTFILLFFSTMRAEALVKCPVNFETAIITQDTVRNKTEFSWI